MITITQTAELLKSSDNILILAHIHPDGDTLGSCFALCHALRDCGKNARVKCYHSIPAVYEYMYNGLPKDEFEPEFVVTVDVADLPLLGGGAEDYGDRIDLCIDHHARSRIQAKSCYVRSTAAACAEIIYDVITEMKVPVSPVIAACLYTGISTDTGCFRFSNTTSYTHEVAACLMKQDYDFSLINRLMFEDKSASRIALEARVLGNMEYFFDGRCAISVITLDELAQVGATEADLDGINSIPRTIKGVLIGITIRETEKNLYKISARTHAPYDASALCAFFGGGGHIRAGGCTVSASSADEVKNQLLSHVSPMLGEAK